MNEEKNKSYRSAQAASYGMGNYETVNKIYDECRFNSSQGHGFAAERANDHIDKLTGHFSRIVGDNNAANGPDRWVNGVCYQTKYYSTARGSINAGFENNGSGTYRYMQGPFKPMKLEVPSDQYEQAVEIMREKIENGQVPGIKDPQKANDLIKRGYISYDQSVKIAKAGTIESIVYDAASGAVIGLAAGGISFTLTCAIAMLCGEDFEDAKKLGINNSIEAGKRSALTALFAGQLSKSAFNSALIPGSKALAGLLGPETSAAIVNSFRIGPDIFGAAAVNGCAKILRGNILSSVAALGVFTAMDAVKYAKKEITGKQLSHRAAGNAATIAAGSAGFLLGQAIIPIPVIGGLIGSFIAGATSGCIVNDTTYLLEEINPMIVENTSTAD
ncbi:MAG: hypothetical protein K6F99_04215 [Lachnospiraceae bacterium]|nr:hypothetical protein [Lachnospiraceae bacterium]